MEHLVATIAVDNTFFSFDTDYSYIVPDDIADQISVGRLVKVPFGRNDKLRDGIVISLDTDDDISGLKYIDSLYEQVLSQEMVLLAVWLKDRCFCTTYDCLKQMLPRGFGRISSKQQRMVRLVNDTEFPKLTPKQQMVCDLLLDVGTAGANEICEFCSVGIGVLKTLEKNGVVEFYNREVYRNPYTDVVGSACDKKPILLSDEQQRAYDTYADMLDDGGTGLLFGVTGSGKTQVYMSLIDKAIEMGRDVIVLVPEISLTPQTLRLFHSRYGDIVAVIHSGLSIGERNDEYKRLDRGDARIAIGTRSAVFAPLHNVGLIIMDEEQEHTYKSERSPRYNAKDVARFRAKYNKALFLMTSATPSIESYSNAVNGKYTLCTLGNRYGDAQLPDVVTVDMKQEMRLGNKTPLSAKLKELLQLVLDNGKQAILLINRRGYNTFIACNDCGHVLTCPHCSISLTYHSSNNRLVCHYCGYTKQLDNICPECGGNGVRYSGYGTQRIEDELRVAFPNARILRMDADTTSTKFSHERLLSSFADGEYDFLIGTQMVAKGLDFDNVALVGVVNADNSLYDENYTAAERSFDLITQVIGRAGRRSEKGLAVVQTINPYNNIIEYAAEQDYIGFYKNEIDIRRLMIYPPYCDLLSITITGCNENTVALAAKRFFDYIVEYNHGEYNELKFVVLGPTPARIAKINNNYRYRITLKCKNSNKIRTMITKILKNMSKIKEYKDVSISVDINPYDIS